MAEKINFKASFKNKYLFISIISLVLPVIFIPILKEANFANPELMKYILLLGGIGNAIFFGYGYNKIRKIENPIDIGDKVLKLNWPEQITIELKNIKSAEWNEENEIVINLIDRNPNLEGNKFIINIKELLIRPSEFCKNINERIG